MNVSRLTQAPLPKPYVWRDGEHWHRPVCALMLPIVTRTNPWSLTVRICWSTDLNSPCQWCTFTLHHFHRLAEKGNIYKDCTDCVNCEGLPCFFATSKYLSKSTKSNTCMRILTAQCSHHVQSAIYFCYSNNRSQYKADILGSPSQSSWWRQGNQQWHWVWDSLWAGPHVWH